MSESAVLFFVGIVVAGTPSVIVALLMRRKTQAETQHEESLAIQAEAQASDVVASAAVRLMTAMEARIADLEVRLARAEERERLALERLGAQAVTIAQLRQEVSALKRQMGEP